MQAMSAFQQAAAQAMASAMHGMQGIPGMNMSSFAAQPVGANPQQAYTDTMTAIAMQQAAAAAAAGQQVGFFPGAGFMPMMTWAPQPAPAPGPTPQLQQQPSQAAQPAPAPAAPEPTAQPQQQQQSEAASAPTPST
jgi:hypothetical protein